MSEKTEAPSDASKQDNDQRESNNIKNVSDFLLWVKKVTKSFGLRHSTLSPWYRGHHNHEWTLKPSLYRCKVDKDMERELLRDFKLRATEFLDHRDRTDIDWLFLAQHYGIPTRLLDWAENALVALFFSSQGHQEGRNGRVWAMNAWELNKTTIHLQSVPTTDSGVFSDYLIDISSPDVPRTLKAKYPLAIRPYHVFRRSSAQSGMFTIHGSQEKAIDKLSFVRRNKSACLLSIIIDGKYKQSILRELYTLGITAASLFQEIDYISQTIRYRYSKFYLGVQSYACSYRIGQFGNPKIGTLLPEP